MKLSIVTINRNNADGLRKTLASVAAQTCKEFEHVVIDGASTDGSADIVKEYADKASYPVKWVSEPDKGIYNAMNKGIRMASGEYIQILNSADLLYDEHVVERMFEALEEKKSPDILYGNMIKEWPDGHRLNDKCESGRLSMLSFYHGTLNHNPAYIRHSLFDTFGYYDETLKIVSDWKWYLQVIPLGGITPVYTNINVTIFDMTGVSESNPAFWKVERRPVLEALVPKMILDDYDRYANDMRMVDRLRRHHLYGMVYFLERVLFKFEKWGLLKK